MSAAPSPLALRPPSISTSSGSSPASSTPKRPPRTARTFSVDGKSPNKAGEGLEAAAHRTLILDEPSEDVDKTPRRPKGLPTPPNSESTSSGSAREGHVDLPSPSSNSPLPRSSAALGLSTQAATSPDPSQDRSRGDVSSRSSSRRGTLEDSLHVPRSTLHRQGSSATIRTTGSGRTDGDSRRSVMSSASQSLSVGRASETSTQRRRRSEMHEREVSEIRSESRLGRYREDDDEADSSMRSTLRPRQQPPSLSRASSNMSNPVRGESSTATDTSGTEGAGPISNSASGRRRRKKSTSSSNKARGARGGHGGAGEEDWDKGSRESEAYADHGAGRRVASPPSINERPGPERRGSAGRISTRRLPRNEAAQSPRSPELGLELFPTSSSVSQRSSIRAGLPTEFGRGGVQEGAEQSAWTRSRLRSDSVASVDSAFADADDRGGAAQGGAPHRQYPASRNVGYSRRRHVSDTSTPGEIPAFDYEGRGGTQGSRLLVDASSASRHLGRVRHSDQPSPSHRGEWAGDASLSPSAMARQRKISTSSATSAASSSRSAGALSGAHSDGPRSSRPNVRRTFAGDVFDDEHAPPMPALGSAQQSPGGRLERIRALRQARDELQGAANLGGGEAWMSELDQLRSRIDELSVAGGGRADSRMSSRSSLAAAGAPRSAQTLRHYDALAGNAARAPYSEPRQPRVNHSRAATLSGLEKSGGYDDEEEDYGDRSHLEVRAGLRTQQSSRVGLRAGDPQQRAASYDLPDRGPSTPDMALGNRAVQSAILPSTARFASGGARGSSDSLQQQQQQPLHEKNLYSAFSIFERHFAGTGAAGNGGQPGTPSGSHASGRGQESLELVARFKAVTAAAAQMNADLRAVVQMTVEAQIDAELTEASASGKSIGGSSAAALQRIDRELSQTLRTSDEQLRNLTDGLVAFTRAERERDRLRKAMVNETGSTGRPGSRLSLHIGGGTSGGAQQSPEKGDRPETRLGNGRASVLGSGRRSVLERDPQYPSPIRTEGAGLGSARSERTRRLLGNRDLADGGVDSPSPMASRAAGVASPITPSTGLAPSSASANTWSASGAGGATTISRRSSVILGTHTRSVSELSPGRGSIRGSRRSGEGAMEGQRVRGKASTASIATVRPPALSHPAVDTTTVSGTPATAQVDLFPDDVVLVGDDQRGTETGLGVEQMPMASSPVMSRTQRRSTLNGVFAAADAGDSDHSLSFGDHDASGRHSVAEARRAATLSSASSDRHRHRLSLQPGAPIRPPRHDLMRRDSTEDEAEEGDGVKTLDAASASAAAQDSLRTLDGAYQPSPPQQQHHRHATSQAMSPNPSSSTLSPRTSENRRRSGSSFLGVSGRIGLGRRASVSSTSQTTSRGEASPELVQRSPTVGAGAGTGGSAGGSRFVPRSLGRGAARRASQALAEIGAVVGVGGGGGGAAGGGGEGIERARRRD